MTTAETLDAAHAMLTEAVELLTAAAQSASDEGERTPLSDAIGWARDDLRRHTRRVRSHAEVARGLAQPAHQATGVAEE